MLALVLLSPLTVLGLLLLMAAVERRMLGSQRPSDAGRVAAPGRRVRPGSSGGAASSRRTRPHGD